MEYLLFVAYLVLFAWLITKVKFFTNSGLTNPQLVILFFLKVMAGIVYGWIGIYYGEMAQMVDTWYYHFESIKEYHLLQTNPSEFFTNLFHNTYKSGYANFLVSENSWWNDLKGSFFIKILAIFNVLSFGQYYVNVIFYSFLSLFGPVAIYRVMQDVFPTRKIAVLLATFLIPSFLYWTSGLHKEGIIFVGLALIIYQIYFSLKEKRFPIYRLALTLLGFLLVLALRNSLVVVLIPALVAWLASHKLKFKPIVVYSSIFVLFIILFFSAKYIHPKFDFPEAVVLKQQEFMKLGGGSAVTVEELKPTFTSFIINAPKAFSLSIIRPYPSDVHHLLSLAADIEIDFLLLLFIILLFWRKNGGRLTPFLLFCIIFSLGTLMMIGYSVNVLGAIVRYRSIILPFLVVPLVANIDWYRINKLIFGNIRNNNNI